MDDLFIEEWGALAVSRVSDIVLHALDNKDATLQGNLTASCRDAYRTGFQDAIKLLAWH